MLRLRTSRSWRAKVSCACGVGVSLADATPGRLDFVSDGAGYTKGYELPYSPKQLFLEDQGHKTLIVKAARNESVVELDTETGKKLGEFRFTTREDRHAPGVDMDVAQITADRKFGNVNHKGDVFDLNLVGPKTIAAARVHPRRFSDARVLTGGVGR